MSSPPFRLAAQVVSLHQASAAGSHVRPCCEDHADGSPAASGIEIPATSRLRLHQLNPHYHCSVIGTCLTTAELRKLVARHAALDRSASDQDVHGMAVALAEHASDGSRSLHKALDRRHASAIAQFAKARDEAALARLWSTALDSGEIPGAYWAVLTHRDGSDELRRRAFGDVHMLSHLVGAANRADIRRLMALEHDNAALNERLDRQQARLHEVIDERDGAVEALRLARLAHVALQSAASVSPDDSTLAETMRQVALQTERRDKAEQLASSARSESQRTAAALIEMQAHCDMLARELAAAEAGLRSVVTGEGSRHPRLESQLHGRRVAYIGGRPSSTPLIRELVQRHGGSFAHHDGGLEDRKGLLTSTIVGADLVAFPMDCIDHDSVHMIKRLCARHGVAFLPLRTATAASLMSALGAGAHADDAVRFGPLDLKHG